MILCLLQNSWCPRYAGAVWPRASWLGALELSLSGRRLIQITGIAPTADPEGKLIWYDNTTKVCGATPDSVLPIDHAHVKAMLARTPEAVLACGRQAAQAVEDWTGRLLVIPHPAYRLLNTQTIRTAREILRGGFPNRAQVWPVKPDACFVANLETNP